MNRIRQRSAPQSLKLPRALPISKTVARVKKSLIYLGHAGNQLSRKPAMHLILVGLGASQSSLSKLLRPKSLSSPSITHIFKISPSLMPRGTMFIVLSRLSDFLPKMALANQELEEDRAKGTLEERQLEKVLPGAAYIEMVRSHPWRLTSFTNILFSSPHFPSLIFDVTG
jgi:hypothetical protein